MFDLAALKVCLASLKRGQIFVFGSPRVKPKPSHSLEQNHFMLSRADLALQLEGVDGSRALMMESASVED